VLEPILSQIAVNERVIGDAGKAKDENESQQQSGCCGEQEETEMLAHQVAHVY
jgi:hypothetical protein